MGFRRIFSVLALFTILFAVNAGAQTVARPAGQLTPEQIAKMPVVALPIKDFKLLTSDTGWVSTGNRLLLTTDNGAHWKDISPPVPAPSNPNESRFGEVFFLDTQTGWVISAGDLQESNSDSDETETVLSSTVDGGATWTAVILPRLKPLQKVGGVNFTFADRLKGWLMIQHQSGPAFSFSSLYSTSDGGRTWHEAKGNPGFYGELLTSPTGDIWASGGPDDNDEIAVSRDGGNSFEEISMDAPKEIAPAELPSYGLPVFNDGLSGYESVSYRGPGGSKSAAVLFATVDGGRTWKPDRILSNLVDAETVNYTVIGSTWIVPFAPQGTHATLMKLRANDRLTAPVHRSSGDFRSCELSFSTSDEGWANCSGILSSTIDGGSNWTEIAPRIRNGVLTADPITPVPAPKPLKTHPIKLADPKAVPSAAYTSSGGPQSGIDQHLGFDRDLILSTGDMATWWISSPYYDVGIYLPGGISGPVNAPSMKHPELILLDSDWVDTVIGQGWGIIPIWSGPQAPCTVEPHKHYFSTNPIVAEVQGQEQADLAYNSATNLGLDGSIIYVDIEEYNHTVCGPAVEAYVNGWVEEMHEYGQAGVYGNQDVAALDMTAADDGYITRADYHVTVWGLNHYSGSGLTDDLAWTNKQRIHQYQINKYEKWGGAGPNKIDNDLIDATIVPSSGTKSYTFQADVTMSNAEELVGINNGVNNGTALQMGTVLGYDLSGNIFTYSPAAGTAIVPAP